MNPLVRPALVLFVMLSVLTGLVYPLAVTGIAQAAFPQQAAGSLIVRDGKPVGSALIGQSFSDPKYFWSRPSATAPAPHNAGASGGSNLGPRNPSLAAAVKRRIEALREADRGLGPSSADRGLAPSSADRGSAPSSADPGDAAPVPVDLVTASGSGLDPHISLAAALYQVPRVARARGQAPAQLQALIAQHREGQRVGFLGEPRVNVLQLNLALDAAGR
jgi:potassium-transporting ATPase KdpC subunit